MNLYKLTIIKENYKGIIWDSYLGFVIAADTPKEARKIANADVPEIFDEYGFEQGHDLETGKEHPLFFKNNIWLKPKYTKIQKIGVSSKGIKKGVILKDFYEA